MARKKPHEDHLNHEAWAIPYGDLITLLLAFFVVMYSISSVNEGKFRILSDALIRAFNGAPRSISPVQLGTTRQRGTQSEQRINMFATQAMVNPIAVAGELHTVSEERRRRAKQLKSGDAAQAELEDEFSGMVTELEAMFSGLIAEGRIRLRRSTEALEIEIAADVLYRSGSAALGAEAVEVLERVAGLLATVENPVKVEGHTDDVPIRTARYPSNWELSAARAGGVVHLLATRGVAAQRLSIHGFGEQRPIADNTTVAGRQENRRVTLVVVAVQDRGSASASGPNPAPPGQVSRPRGAQGAGS